MVWEDYQGFKEDFDKKAVMEITIFSFLWCNFLPFSVNGRLCRGASSIGDTDYLLDKLKIVVYCKLPYILALACISVYSPLDVYV